MANAPHRSAILITGASGMVGSYVLAELLRRGEACAVLVRPKGQRTASERVDQILRRFEQRWQVQLGRPQVLTGDLNQRNLGLGSPDRQFVTEHCNRILHSAASLSFLPASDHADDEPYRTNVQGTENVISFCQSVGIEEFHHVSTAYVCGQRSGRVFESESDVGQSFANDYERSKVIAERTVAEAFAAKSLTVYRPSIVIDRTGLAPVSGDRTIYGAFSMYQMLASRFGLPEDGQWFRNLGFEGAERKNIVDVDWIARAIRIILESPQHHRRTYHLTTRDGTSIRSLDEAFHSATEQWLARRESSSQRTQSNTHRQQLRPDQGELDQLADPFVKTFLPYFRDDPVFDRANIDQVVATTRLDQTPEIGCDELLELVGNWAAPAGRSGSRTRGPSDQASVAQPASVDPAKQHGQPLPEGEPQHSGEEGDEIVICGYEVRLPGGVENAADFEQLLWSGQSAIEVMPEDRLDRSLYFDPQRGVPGKTYTQLGGCVEPKPLDEQVERTIEALGQFDLTHRQFAQVAAAALKSAFAASHLDEVPAIDAMRAGMFVGHSGGTKDGGPLAMSTMAATACELIGRTDVAQQLGSPETTRLTANVTGAIRHARPQRQHDGSPHLNAYSAASLAARLLGFRGRREVIDAACSSSLLALHHAASAIRADRLDVAIVGGATYNNVDNLALFSQSGACSDSGSYPFDQRASGLISSEGYVAMVLVRRSIAERVGLPIHATLRGVGVASDGKGKGLWAPLSDGQQLAIRRAADGGAALLDIDYLECHATSTQVGDATELQSLTALLREQAESSSQPNRQLPIGSVKSNLGHLLEAAGLVGMVKCLLAMRRGEIPPSINFSEPTELYDWADAPVRVVDQVEPWSSRRDRGPRVAAVNAFGIGGLNAHAVVEQNRSVPLRVGKENGSKSCATQRRTAEPIAVVGRGVVLPGAASVEEFAALLASGASQLSDPPPGRWQSRSDGRGLLGVRDEPGQPFAAPHCRGGYIREFQFDAQAYRIPPKMVQNANPAQLMLIEAVRQAIDEYDGGKWTLDRQRIGVVVGTIFGGQFSNELQIGLRLPELCRHLSEAARASGVDSEHAAPLVNEFRAAVLSRYPALLDETGGFTASTLASRIARTFDLMGGACAVDADEASGGLALMTAVEQLHAGQVDAVLCGVTQRSMDLVAFEQLYRKNQLVDSGRLEDLPEDGSRIFPGEGVAIMMLQRQSDALAQGRRIYAIIDGQRESWTDDARAERASAYRASQQHDRVSARRLLRQIGHLGGGQGLVRSIASTIVADSETSPTDERGCPPVLIRETADDGYQVEYQISFHPILPMRSSSASELEPVQKAAHPAARPEPSVGSSQSPVASVSGSQAAPHPRPAGDVLALRLQADNRNEFGEAIRSVAQGDRAAWQNIVTRFQPTSGWGDTAVFQAGLVGRDEDELRAIAQALLTGPFEKGESAALPQKTGWVRCPSPTGSGRVAWLFPGQGSQYAAMPDVLADGRSVCEAELAGARRFLERFDAQLDSLGLDPVANRLTDPDGLLGRDVWWTQLWVLAVGATLTDSLLRRGHRPDVVLGHSFGECTAAWAAGAMSIRQAIQFAKDRSDAVVMTTRGQGQLLSVRGEPGRIDAVLRQSGVDYTITHHNSLQQTVIAGSSDQMGQAKTLLSDARLASVVIPVPAAFHTPAMQSAQSMLRARFAGQRALPPRFAFLSAVSNEYLAEPNAIIENLIGQLTQPVCFSGAAERLVNDGCELLIEVGPSDVLTRLARPTVGGRAICLSADDRNRDRILQQALIDLACEACQRATSDATRPGVIDLAAEHRSASQPNPAPNGETRTPPRRRFQVIDVTKHQRRSRPEKPRPNGLAAGRTTSNGDPRAATNETHAAIAANGRSPMVARTSPAVASADQAEPSALRYDAGSAGEGSGTGSRREAAQSFLFALVVDLTGYDPEIIDFDADLEGELGVDSIKKAQLIGEIVQWGNLNLDTQSMRLSQFASLADILALVDDPSSPEPSGLVEAAAAEAQPLQANSTQAIRSQTGIDWPPASRAAPALDGGVPASRDAEVQTADADSVRRFLIDLVVDQTGYDEDIIDVDADLEGELGVDSIKKAQLFGELEQQYQLQSQRQMIQRLSDFPTLASIQQFVLEQIGDGEKKNAAPLVQPASTSEPSAAPPSSVDSVPGEPSAPANHSAVPGQRLAGAPTPELLAPPRGTHRFLLGVQPAPRREAMPTEPRFYGPALVVGDNPIADVIMRRWDADPLPIQQIGCDATLEQIDAMLDALWSDGVSQHLFLTTPHDANATWLTSDSASWQTRRAIALSIPYRICQRWMQRVIDDGLMSKASLVSILKLGGSFGFDSASSQAEQVDRSAESGGLAGLTKAMLIEAWMRGFRDTPMLIVDAVAGHPAEAIVDGAWRELAVPSYDEEVAVAGEQRLAVRASYRPLPSEIPDPSPTERTRYPLTRGGNWIIAGGGRGITAMTAMALAERHDLTLHLLGTAAVPDLDEPTRAHAARDRGDLRRHYMSQVQRQGGNPVKAWRDFEKAIEIDQTLRQCRQRSIRAVYHSVDVSDAEALADLLAEIRASDGPIRGVIQGAGAGQDARFDRKRPDKVEKCLRAKIDGCIALADATIDDPLEWFIGFGSISGRFGANGHTDYSAANEMLAKLIGRTQVQRPATRCVTFHWHAWGDVGMATKPEAKLALDMIGMDFMPASEGLQHFLNEVERGGDATEVLITDRRYVRKFFPAGEGSDVRHETSAAPMIDPHQKWLTQDGTNRSGSASFAVTLDPTTDLFLKDHLVHGRPTLPFVMAIEMLAEAARRHSGKQVTHCDNVRAIRPLKCVSDDAFAVELLHSDGSAASETAEGSAEQWTLTSDLRLRDGRLVEAARPHFSASFTFGECRTCDRMTPADLLEHLSVAMQDVEYLSEDAPVYHGASLRCLRRIGFVADGDAVNSAGDANGTSGATAVGLIVAPSPAHLTGEARPLSGWAIPPAVMDAVLYAAGMLAYRVGDRPSLPTAFDRITLGRLPDPGEPLRVVVRWDSRQETSDGGTMSAVLAGLNRDLILRLDGYRVGWLG